jgi:glycosyltransferase involved in cell wall biosynthesis
MKIDLIITELAVGGAEQCLTNLATYLDSQGYTVRVFSLSRKPSADRLRLVETLAKQEIEVHFLGAVRWWQWPLVLWQLFRHVRRSKPDLAQAFLFHANVTAACVYPWFKIPLIGGIRVVDPRRRRRWLNWLSTLAMKKVVCVSQSVADYCIKTERIATEKVIVIANGIRCQPRLALHDEHEQASKPVPDSDESYAQRQLGLAPTTPCLLFVGRIDHQKGADVLIEQSEAILTALPLHHLILIGNGPLKVALQTRASHSRLESRIHFVGRRDDILHWMRSSELLVLPTRYEGMPNVILEAMACGLPIVSTQAEGILELLGDGASEQTVPVGQWADWTAKVIQIAGEPNQHRKLSEANLNRCLRYFDLDEKMQQYERLYRNPRSEGL